MTDLATAPNFRDLGGWTAVDGRKVRSGLIFRSEALLTPTSADAGLLAARGIILVCDLRSDSERAHAPNEFWAERGVEVQNLDILAGVHSTLDPWRVLQERPDAVGAREAMLSVYAAMPAAAAPHLLTILQRIDAGDLPMLIHCTVGKDRTGFVSAVLLTALGVPNAAVREDYLTSQGRRGPHATEATRTLVLARTGKDLEIEALEAMMGVDRAYLDRSFAVIEAQHGGIAPYLAAAGADGDLLARVRDRLLD